MPRVSRWSCAPGTLLLELAPGDKMPEALRPLLKPEEDGNAWGEIVIHFESTGHYDEGCMYQRNGDPGDPPEGDDDRSLLFATLDGVKLDQAIAEACFGFWADKIQDEELSYRYK